MDAASIGAFGLVYGKEILHLQQYFVERTRLVAGCRLDRVAVHRIADPHDVPALLLHGSDKGGKQLQNLVSAETADERKTTRDIIRIKDVDQFEKPRRGQRGSAFEADRVS